MSKMVQTSESTSTPQTSLPFDPNSIDAQWLHADLVRNAEKEGELTKGQLRILAYDYYLKFLPHFRNQPEGSIAPSVEIEFTGRMKQKLGMAYLFEHKIKLNLSYFTKEPALLPYTLFHEMTHLWLYCCGFDPGHTQRFYNKMSEFETSGLPVDLDVHIHTRVAPEGKYVYSCPNCSNRWYMREQVSYSIFCGHCFDQEGIEYFAKPKKITRPKATKP